MTLGCALVAEREEAAPLSLTVSSEDTVDTERDADAACPASATTAFALALCRETADAELVMTCPLVPFAVVAGLEAAVERAASASEP